LPAVTLADRVAAALVVLAGSFAGALLARHGWGTLAWLPPLAGITVAAGQAVCWSQSRRRAGWVLRRGPDATLVVQVAGQGAVRAAIGPRTRILGPSVFIDVHCAVGGVPQAYRRWLTPLDVPAAALRRWSVVLPHAGRVAR
jgi:hypothetical protein